MSTTFGNEVESMGRRRCRGSMTNRPKQGPNKGLYHHLGLPVCFFFWYFKDSTTTINMTQHHAGRHVTTTNVFQWPQTTTTPTTPPAGPTWWEMCIKSTQMKHWSPCHHHQRVPMAMNDYHTHCTASRTNMTRNIHKKCPNDSLYRCLHHRYDFFFAYVFIFIN